MDWIALLAALAAVGAVFAAYFGAKIGSQGAVTAAQITARTTHVTNLIAIAQALTTSDDAKQRATGRHLLLVAAQTMASMEDAPLLIKGVTRAAGLEQVLQEARSLEDETGQQPDVEYLEEDD